MSEGNTNAGGEGSGLGGPKRGGLRLGRLFGIEIRLDLSVLIVFSLVVYGLGAGLFPQWHPTWSGGQSWMTAVAAGVLFFTSLLAHEMAHSLVARRRGIGVRRITLFIFGGVSELEQEPDTPTTELLIAIAGPATSLGLGLLFSFCGELAAGPGFAERVDQDLQGAMAGVGPLATLLLWLGPVNMVLGAFNLVPGFPLDGGRVLRAILWRVTGSLQKATAWASEAGRIIALAVIGFGVWLALGGALIPGIWLLLIGWFLSHAAKTSYSQMVFQQALRHLRVDQLMESKFEVIAPNTRLDEFVDGHLLRSSQSSWPVVRGQELVGIITFDRVRASDEARRAQMTVADAMDSVDEVLTPGLDMQAALRILVQSEHDPLPVVDGSKVVGLLHRGDVMRWLALHHLEPSN